MILDATNGYRKIDGRYPSYKEYLIYFECSDCKHSWAIDDAEIKDAELDELSLSEDIISDSIKNCPLCGSVEIACKK